MTKKECLNLAIKYLNKRLRRIQTNLCEDYESFELTGEYIHYTTEEGFEKAKKEETELGEAIAELIAIRDKEDEKTI